MVEISEQPEVTLQDFVIPAKIQAFCDKYKPLDHWREAATCLPTISFARTLRQWSVH